MTNQTPTAPAGVRRRRVIFVNRFFYPDTSATSQMLSDLVQGLGGLEFDLHVICSQQLYGEVTARLATRDYYAEAAVHRVRTAHFGRDRLLGRALDYLTFLVSATLQMASLTRRDDVLVAMTDPPMLSICAALVVRLRRAVLINWLQDIFPEVATELGALRLPWPVTRILHAARTWSLRTARRNVVLGTQMSRRIAGFGVPAHKQQIIENWADGTALAPRPPRWSAVRRSLDTKAEFVIQYSGNLGRAHDFWTMLNAALELRNEPGWLFLFTAGGANLRRLEAETERHGLTNICVLPHAPREQLGDTLAAGDVHLMSLLPPLEGLIVPSKFYGILAAGRPVIFIGDPDGEQARIVRAEGCGAVVSCGDSAALVDCLRMMRSDPDRLHSIGVRARALFERRYAVEHALAKWRRVLTSSDVDLKVRAG